MLVLKVDGNRALDERRRTGTAAGLLSLDDDPWPDTLLSRRWVDIASHLGGSAASCHGWRRGRHDFGWRRDMAPVELERRRGGVSPRWDLIADCAERVQPSRGARASPADHYERVGSAGGQHLKDFGECEKLVPYFADPFAALGNLDLVGLHGIPPLCV
jgi:hypothetical protein